MAPVAAPPALTTALAMTSTASFHERPLRSHTHGRNAARLVLERAADDGALSSEEWPPTLQYILSRLDEIVDEFPRPTHVPSEPQTLLSSQDSQAATDKENAPPTTPTRPPVPSFSTSSSDPQSLPQDTVNFYTSIRTTLSKNFPKHPPHTIQRLAELILDPKRRYAYLPPYLRALDRVVSVSSPLTIFPLPQAVLPTAGSLLNGTAPTPQSTLGSDESLGGALLTPIPWLQNRGQSELISESTEMVDGPHGAGRIETVSVINGNGGMTATSSTSPSSTPALTPSSTSSSPMIGVAQIASSHPDGETLPSTGPVTQGEILRQEQEAGIVLSNPHSINPSRTLVSDPEAGATILDTVEPEDEVPHARGPEIIGMEDTGPQKQGRALDIEGAVGRPSLDGARASKSPGPAAQEQDDEVMAEAEDAKTNEQEKEAAAKEEEKEDEDEDMKADE
ncbi:hypothetical protein K505DRAFT_272030 [Melanomma pulvis-pyrius CBS 109.77]|uniref:PPP4R2-domain-containing protein n=1 Tax=Melanomma pulvis-pyrius CBS 109.77 TaxID=1314802 RepID=A0A6A6XJL4_9PLEO|nr:hypothetical protein K505DRAFT_272030 [Melanomma pulvis-pyrius CBS 109.77]